MNWCLTSVSIAVKVLTQETFTIIVEGTVSQLSRYIGVKMSDRRCDT